MTSNMNVALTCATQHIQHTTQIPPSHIPLPPSTHTRNDDDDTGGNGNAEGGDCLNGIIVGRQYGRPCDRHPVRGPGVIHVEASAGIRAGIRSRMMTGQEGEGGGGNMMGSAFLMMTTTTMNTMTMTNTMARRMGRGRAGERTMGENLTTTVATSSTGHPLAAWGIGHRSLAPMLPPLSSRRTMTTIAATVRGHRAPPLRSVPSRRTQLVIVNVANRG